MPPDSFLFLTVDNDRDLFFFFSFFAMFLRNLKAAKRVPRPELLSSP